MISDMSPVEPARAGDGAALSPTTDASDYRIRRTGGLVPVVVASLTHRIVSGEFDDEPGLPHSAELVEQFGVSRTVIREALRVLEAKQLISIQQGRQTIVLPSDRWDLLDPVVIAALTEGDLSLTVFTELVHVRAALEAEMARGATERMLAISQDDPNAASAELQGVADAYAALEAAYAASDGSPAAAARYLDLDRAFHQSVMNLSQNRFARRIVEQVFVWARRGQTDAVRHGDVETSHTDHTAIFDHIRNGDADLAYHAMRNHILLHWAPATRERLTDATARGMEQRSARA